MNSRIAKFRGVKVFVQANDEIVGNFERKRSRYLHEGLPTALRVRAEGLAVCVGDLAVSEAIQVSQRELGGSMVIQNYVRHSMQLCVTGDGDGWGRKGSFQLCINCQNAVHTARL